MSPGVWFGAVSGLAMVLALAVSGGDARQGLAGWALGFASGLAGWLIDARTVGLPGERSVLLGLVAHSVRAMALLLVVAVVRFKCGSGCDKFVVATLVVYFVFLFAEIARLARLGR